MRTAEAVEAYRLAPDPWCGWSRVTDHAPGRLRVVLWLLDGTDYAGWHRVPGDVLLSVEDGGACAASRSADGFAADAVHLGAAPGLARWARIPEGAAMTLQPVGAWSLLRATYVPDAELTARGVLPDDWFPGRGWP